MRVKEIVFEHLRADYSLRKKISDETGVRETSICQWYRRKQHAKVGFYTVAEIIKAYTGLTDEEFFEDLPPTCKSL
jgi:hypothetical protein